MKLLIAVFSGAILVSGCIRLGGGGASQRGERLAIERGRLVDLSDPVDRTRSYIAISELLLGFAFDAVKENDTADLDALMEQYVIAVRNARDTIVDSDHEQRRRREGYRSLEASLRRQGRRLREIRRRLDSDQRIPMDQALAASTSVHNEILGLLRTGS